MRILAVLLIAVIATGAATAQFEILDAKTSASLRGIDAVSSQVAWASGSGGTVLLTSDGGKTWKHCAVPPGGEKLDFRGVQGFDAATAFVMASGRGPASAIYKTDDGCASWTLAFANPDAEGFFDALLLRRGGFLEVMGDQVGGRFTIFRSADAGATWQRDESAGLEAVKGAGGFAASNSGLIALGRTRAGSTFAFATSATEAQSPKVYLKSECAGKNCVSSWIAASVPMPPDGASSGIFSLAADGSTMVAVGGAYPKPADRTGTAAFSVDGGKTWRLAEAMPRGYRSAVAYSASAKGWLAVGPNGCDFSRDGGVHWTAIEPNQGDAADLDKNWNAISLPFVVGSKGRVGRLKAGVLGR